MQGKENRTGNASLSRKNETEENRWLKGEKQGESEKAKTKRKRNQGFNA